MKNKKMLAALLACSMLTSALAGCGSPDSSAETTSGSKTAKSADAGNTSSQETAEASTEASTEGGFDPRSITEGVKLTIATKDRVKVEDWNTNEMTLMIEEALGVDLEFITYPEADYASKINVIALSGEELPDIIFDPGDSLQTLMDEELLLDLSEYYDNPDYAVNINDASERIGMDIKTYQTQANGAVYGIPSFSQNPGADVYQKLWVYQPWLDALGVELPETTDEFYEVCKLISQTDLNGNGKNDELGLTGTDIGGWFDCLMTPFVFAHDSQFRTMTDGQVGFAYTTEEWKEGLKYIKKFFDEGLIPKETLTQDKDQYNSFVFSEEPVLFAFCGWCYEGSDIVRRSELSGIPALEGPNGVKNACYIPSIPSGTGAVITVDCENPEAAFLVCDYLCSEDMSNINRYGKLGVNWDYWENAKETIENPEEYGSAYGYEMFMITYYQDGVDFWYDPNPQNVCYFQNGPYVRDSLANLGYVMKTANLSEEETLRLFNETKDIAVQNDCYNYLPDEVFDYGPLTTEETSQTADIKTNLNNYVKEATSAFLTGSMDIDADWDAYLKELENIGYKTMLETYQTAYDRVH